MLMGLACVSLMAFFFIPLLSSFYGFASALLSMLGLIIEIVVVGGLGFVFKMAGIIAKYLVLP